MILSLHLTLHLLSGMHLSLFQISLLSLLCLHLLILDHSLNRAALQVLLLPLHIEHIFLLALLLSDHFDIALRFFSDCGTIILDIAANLVFLCSILLNFHILLVIELSLPFSLEGCGLNIPMPLTNNILGSFLSFVDFLPSFLFLELQKLNAVRQKLFVLLGPLACYLGGNELTA